MTDDTDTLAVVSSRVTHRDMIACFRQGFQKRVKEELEAFSKVLDDIDIETSLATALRDGYLGFSIRPRPLIMNDHELKKVIHDALKKAGPESGWFELHRVEPDGVALCLSYQSLRREIPQDLGDRLVKNSTISKTPR